MLTVELLQRPGFDLLDLQQGLPHILHAKHRHGGLQGSSVDALETPAAEASNHPPLRRAGDENLKGGEVLGPYLAVLRMLRAGIKIQTPGLGFFLELGRATRSSPVPPGLLQFFDAAAALPSCALYQLSTSALRA